MLGTKLDFAHAPQDPGALYLDLIKRCLLNLIYPDHETALVSGTAFPSKARVDGRGWPSMAHTMIGLRRLENLQYCAETVLKEKIPGDFLEAGVWRGGATIFMRSILQAYGVTDRRVWVADSFAGVPSPDESKYPHDAGLNLDRFSELAVPLERVKVNFARYGLLDDQVVFLKGWFRDTLPVAPIKELAVLRIDGDLYESTMDALTHLYPRLASGGFVIIDDYGDIGACRHAVTDYRVRFEIKEPIVEIDWSGIYWRRS